MLINDFPVELLSEIFEHSVDREDVFYSEEQSYVAQLCPGDAPLSLIHVCQHWRAVAFATSSLWSSIMAQRDGFFKPTIESLRFMVEASQSSPLHLRISCTPSYYPYRKEWTRDKSFTSSSLQLFATQLHRWKSISIKPNRFLLSDFLEVIRENSDKMDTLEKFQIEVYTIHEEVSPDKSILEELAQSLHLFKNLRKLSWLDFYWTMPSHLPWRQLQHITLRVKGISCAQSLIHLAKCESAVSVTFVDPHPRISHDQSLPLGFIPMRTILPHLSYLWLDKASCPDILLKYFTLPSLKVLHIEVEYPALDTLEEFLDRSKCPLEDLIFFDRNFPQKFIPTFFDLSCLKLVARVSLGILSKRYDEDITVNQQIQATRIAHPQLKVYCNMSWAFMHNGQFDFKGRSNLVLQMHGGVEMDAFGQEIWETKRIR